jgi:hypothetical protein
MLARRFLDQNTPEVFGTCGHSDWRQGDKYRLSLRNIATAVASWEIVDTEIKQSAAAPRLARSQHLGFTASGSHARASSSQSWSPRVDRPVDMLQRPRWSERRVAWNKPNFETPVLGFVA